MAYLRTDQFGVDLTAIASAMTVGEDDTGYDVTMYGATSGRLFLWDESADELKVSGKLSQRFGSAFKNHTHAAWAME